MNKDLLISVIVPIYNVERYLTKCIDSILNQTYTNLEIILVDDGSTDNSGKICDEYAEIDKRIKVIHKENGGLSSARNAALNICTGEYISFLDSDDWIERNMLEVLLLNLDKYKADIVNCSYVSEYLNVSEKNIKNVENTTILQDNDIFSVGFTNDIIKFSVWGKLYKKSIFDMVRFPENKFFEDLFVYFDILKLTKRIVIIPDELIHYRIRQSSIMNTLSDKWVNNHIQVYEKLYKDFLEYKQCRHSIEKAFALLIRIKAQIAFIQFKDNQKFDNFCLDNFVKELRNNFFEILQNKYIGTKVKCFICLLSLHKSVAKTAVICNNKFKRSKIYKKKILYD